MGHLAIAFVCYKLAAPARYAVTLGTIHIFDQKIKFI